MEMKRYIHGIFYTLSLLCGVCLMVGCRKDLDKGADDVKNSDIISFTAALQAEATPAVMSSCAMSAAYLTIEDEEWKLELKESSRPTKSAPVRELEGLNVGVYAHEYDDDEMVKYVMHNEHYSFVNNEDLMPVGEPTLWSDVGDENNIRVCAYAPRVSSSTSNFVLSEVDEIPHITYTVPDDVSEHIDLIVTDVKEVGGNFNQSIYLTFSHVLTGIKFKAGFDCTVTSLKIHGVYSTGTYSMTDTWTDVDNVKTYTVPIPDGGIDCKTGDMITDGANTLMLIPQHHDDTAYVTMEYKEGGTKDTITASLKDLKWDPGRLITYTINKTKTDDYVYFDLNAGNVTITPTSYEGYVYVGGNPTRVYQTFSSSAQEQYKYYIYQSTAANKNSMGYVSELGVGAHRRPMYEPVSIGVQFWSDFIANNKVVEKVIETWDTKAGITADKNNGSTASLTGAVRKVGRSSTGNRITVKGSSSNPVKCNMVIDDVYSHYQQASESRTTGGITFLPESQNSYLDIELNGDNRFGAIHYVNSYESTRLRIRGVGSLTVADVDFDKSRSPFSESKNAGKNIVGYSSNHWCSAIGGDDTRQEAVGIVIDGGDIYAGTTAAENCTAIGGGGNGYGVVTINGGSVTAVATTTGTAIGGGIGYHSAGGEGKVEINGGKVYAYNYANEWNIPSAAIGGGSSSSSDGKYGRVTINNGYVYAESAMGTAIGGGSSKTKNGGGATVTISGGTIVARSISTEFFPAGASIGGGTGGTDGGKNGGNATVTISGNPVVRTGSIGGGKTNSATGGKKGNATITVSGGDISAQFIMEAGSATKSKFTMEGGVIRDSYVNDKEYEHIETKGGAVYMENGTFTMKGGTIRNCKAIEGGAVYIKGIESPEFIMEGGEIINNISETNGGAVYLEGGTVTISGGQLRSNLAKNGNGGAIYINAGDFYMTEGSTGTIFRNVALKTSETNAGHGGGIYVTSVSSDVDVDVEVLSGRVENNVCDGNGGGICVDMAGTTRTANVKIGKDGVVSDNNPSISTNSAVRYGGGLYAVGEMAKVTINGGKISGNEVFNYVPNPDVTNEGGTVVLNGGKVKHQVVTFDANAADATVEGASTAVQRIVTATNSALVLPETPERNFYDFIGWNSRPDGQGKTYVNGENMNITEDITLYAQWRAQ